MSDLKFVTDYSRAGEWPPVASILAIQRHINFEWIVGGFALHANINQQLLALPRRPHLLNPRPAGDLKYRTVKTRTRVVLYDKLVAISQHFGDFGTNPCVMATAPG
jgi:hypothetical protein